MPYRIRKAGGNKWGVYKRDSGELVAMHKSRRLAEAQFRLLEMMAHEETKALTLKAWAAKHADHDQSDHGNRDGSSGVPRLPDPRSPEPATHYDIVPGGVVQVRLTSSQRDALNTTNVASADYRDSATADPRYRAELADSVDKALSGGALELPSWAAAEDVANTLLSQGESRQQDGRSGASHISAARRIISAARDAGMDVKETYLGVAIRPKE